MTIMLVQLDATVLQLLVVTFLVPEEYLALYHCCKKWIFPEKFFAACKFAVTRIHREDKTLAKNVANWCGIYDECMEMASEQGWPGCVWYKGSVLYGYGKFVQERQLFVDDVAVSEEVFEFLDSILANALVKDRVACLLYFTVSEQLCCLHCLGLCASGGYVFLGTIRFPDEHETEGLMSQGTTCFFGDSLQDAGKAALNRVEKVRRREPPGVSNYTDLPWIVTDGILELWLCDQGLIDDEMECSTELFRSGIKWASEKCDLHLTILRQ